MMKKGILNLKWKLRKKIVCKSKILKLNNTQFTLLSGDCLGGFILHDLGLRFNTPTINLWFYPMDFIKFCTNLKYYCTQELHFISRQGIDYPVAMCGDIEIYFTHYKSEKEACEKWIQRVKRINFDNIFVVMTDANGFCEDMLEMFNQISYPHICFTHLSMGGGKDNLVYLNSDKNGFFHAYCNRLSIHRFYDDFDFIEWFNRGRN
ncbi:MAG: DUF1919 domain-containing protein [Ruminococcus flavefaciens]|nr:DUF1919 domain-containing protein [Ruminococcus flavefaciens]